MTNAPRLKDAESFEGPETVTTTNRFPDLRAGGRALASKLDAYRGRDDVVVLGIVLGGVLTAREVADHLSAPLDYIIIRRLLVPRGPGSQICAVSVAGSIVIDDELPPRPSAPSTPLDYFVNDALAGLQLREQVCRGQHPPINIAGKTIILVDCGIRTALTMQAAINAVRRKEPKKIVAAVPVASIEGLEAVDAIADEIACAASHERFGHTGLFYKDFSRPDDEEVSRFL